MSVFTIKEGDTSPAFQTELTSPNGEPVNLVGASVQMRMKLRDGDVWVTGTPDFEDAQGGLITYYWDSGDTEVPGLYHLEFEVTFEDGTVETFPNHGFTTVHIPADNEQPTT